MADGAFLPEIDEFKKNLAQYNLSLFEFVDLYEDFINLDFDVREAIIKNYYKNITKM